MSAPARFLFDTDFSRPAPAAPSVVALDAHRSAVADAEAAAYRRGEADGARAVRETDAARLVAAIETLGERLSAAVAEADARAVSSERDAVALALAFACKLAGAATARFPMAEIRAAAEACFAEMRAAPHVAVRVAPDFVETVRAELAAIAQDRGFAGRLIVLGDPDVAEGDARLEWADGGVSRDAGAVRRAVESAIAFRFGDPNTDEGSAT